MSDTPANGSRDVPRTVGVFLVLVVVLTLLSTTGSWLSEMFDWTDRGFSSASLPQLAGYFVGGALKYLTLFTWPALLVPIGRELPRRRYAVMSGVLLGVGLVTAALAAWLGDDAPVTTWPHWLVVGVALYGTLVGLTGLGHCAWLAWRSRKARTGR